jgi:beta-glucosidase
MPNAPLYPFGYGLSYTTFAYGDPKTDKTTYKKNEKITVKITVTNTGSRDGEEVVQLYIHDKVGSVTRPVKELKGFQKIMLKAGESKELTFTVTDEELSFFRKDMTFGSEPGEYDIMIGTNSQEVKTTTINYTR